MAVELPREDQTPELKEYRPVRAIAVSPDGKYAYVTHSSPILSVIDLQRAESPPPDDQRRRPRRERPVIKPYTVSVSSRPCAVSASG